MKNVIKKDIKFITPPLYEDLFAIPDGGQIKISIQMVRYLLRLVNLSMSITCLSGLTVTTFVKLPNGWRGLMINLKRWR